MVDPDKALDDGVTARSPFGRAAGDPPHRIQGQLLRRTDRREVAMFVRDGALWVAEFLDGRGELFDAATWVRFNCPGHQSVHARRRMLRECGLPLSDDLLARIEALF